MMQLTREEMRMLFFAVKQDYNKRKRQLAKLTEGSPHYSSTKWRVEHYESLLPKIDAALKETEGKSTPMEITIEEGGEE